MRSPRRPALQALLSACGALLTACGAASAVGSSRIPPVPYPTAPAGPFTVGADTVTVLYGGATAFPVIAELLHDARRRVVVEMYEIQRGDLVEALLAAHDRGVEVTVITDVNAAGSEASAQRLRAGGVDVAAYPVRHMTIDHVKLLAVDGAAAVVGGINWGTASARHHDFDVLVRGPVVANLERVVARDLVTCGRAVTVPPAVGDSAVEVASTLPADEVRPRVLAAIEAARTTLDIELYVLTDLGIVHAIERAQARHVRVHVLLDPTERPSDAPAAEMRSAGIPVRWFASAGELLHAKALVADGRTVVFGSANWSAGGFERNHEIDLVIPDSRPLAGAFARAMEADWSAAAQGADAAAT